MTISPDSRDCDWIVEAVLEDLDVKNTVYNKIKLMDLKAGAAVTSNTSTIPLAQLLDGMNEDFAANFFITHFFNPPRYMRLLEIVSGAHSDRATVDAVHRFCDVALGKTVIACNDTPGFIANRIGGYWIQTAINGAMDLGLTVEEADAVGGRPMGVPKNRHFRPDGSGRHRSHAPGRGQHDRQPAGGRSLCPGFPRARSGPPDDRDAATPAARARAASTGSTARAAALKRSRG